MNNLNNYYIVLQYQGYNSYCELTFKKDMYDYYL